MLETEEEEDGEGMTGLFVNSCGNSFVLVLFRTIGLCGMLPMAIGCEGRQKFCPIPRTWLGG
jgi:hypothetical protein